MTIISWKTNSIDLNKPAKVLSGTADSYVVNSLWATPNADDDPYWSRGPNPKYYRWEVTFTVPDKTHGSNLTRVPFTFNAQDIEVGDWVAGASVGDGKCCQIISIQSKSNNTLTAIVEDRFRYNTFKNSTGDGLFGAPGPVIFFQINELGLPMLDPLPGEAGVDFFSNVMSRFQYMNPLTNYLLEKINHGFEEGDAICIENGEFVLSNSTNVVKFIGTVLHPGPGPDQFILKPSNGIIDFVPGLPGIPGDFIYPSIDNTGDLTIDDTSDLPIFLKIANSIPSVTIGSSPNIIGTDGDIVEINKIKVDLIGDGTTGTYDLDQAIALINTKTPEHKVVADKVGYATTATSDIATLGSAYGLIAGYVPFSADINGTLVTFTTTTSGSATFGPEPPAADVNDIALDINSSKIPNITASVSPSGDLILKNVIGGEINIVNVSQDLNGNDFAGNNSLSSLPLITPANTSEYSLRLSRDDGGPLTLYDYQGLFFNDCGVMSGQNGRYALGLMIERGLATKGKGGAGNVTVTSNIETIVPGSTISIGVDYTNTEYPGGLFTVFQQLPITVNVAAIWATLNSNIKDAYLDFTSNTINSKDVGFSINLTNATFNINSTDDITIGSTIVSGNDLTGLNIVTNGEYIILSSLLGFTDETDSNVSVTANLTTDRGSIYIGNVYLNNIQPTPFAVTSISANWEFSSVPFWDTNQIFNWSAQTIGTALGGTVTYSGGSSGTLAENGEISGSSPTLDSTQSYEVQSSDYNGEGLNGAGASFISDTVSTSLSPATRYYPLFYKTTDNSANPNFTTTDQFIRSQYALGQGADTTANTTKYLWIAIPGTTTHKFAYTIFQTEATVTPDMSYLNQSIAGQSYNVYGFTRASLVTKIYTTS
jgi:hypothetical protein